MHRAGPGGHRDIVHHNEIACIPAYQVLENLFLLGRIPVKKYLVTMLVAAMLTIGYQAYAAMTIGCAENLTSSDIFYLFTSHRLSWDASSHCDIYTPSDRGCDWFSEITVFKNGVEFELYDINKHYNCGYSGVYAGWVDATGWPSGSYYATIDVYRGIDTDPNPIYLGGSSTSWTIP
jgi:hypothetical protein